MNRDLRPLVLLALLVVLVVRTVDRPNTSKVDRITYVYEKDDTSVSPEMAAALRSVNERDIVATAIDDDVKTGTGDVPKQYQSALEAAKGKLPALVVQAGEIVVEVIERPTADDLSKYRG